MRKNYESPEVEIVEVAVEGGVAYSGEKGDNHPDDYEYGGGAF